MKIKSTRTGQVFDAEASVVMIGGWRREINFVYFNGEYWVCAPASVRNTVNGRARVENLFVPAEPCKDY